MSDFWKVFSILASSYGAFGLLTQEFPLVYLNLKVHPAKPYPFKVLVTWTQPGSCLSTPFGPVPVPQVVKGLPFPGPMVGTKVYTGHWKIRGASESSSGLTNCWWPQSQM